jgi:hypothetical protein
VSTACTISISDDVNGNGISNVNVDVCIGVKGILIVNEMRVS